MPGKVSGFANPPFGLRSTSVRKTRVPPAGHRPMIDNARSSVASVRSGANSVAKALYLERGGVPHSDKGWTASYSSVPYFPSPARKADIPQPRSCYGRSTRPVPNLSLRDPAANLQSSRPVSVVSTR